MLSNVQRFSGSMCLAVGFALAALLCTAGPAQAAPDAKPALTRGAGSEASRRAGAFCTPARCRPAKGSLWSTAAFGAVVVVIHRSARRQTR
jgi:hypothetical protein